MSNLLATCENLAKQGKIKKIADSAFFVGTVSMDDPKFQQFQQKYAEDFGKRRQAREVKEREAALKQWKEGPRYF